MYELLSDIVTEAYRAKFEDSVYKLAYDKINVDTISELAKEAADALYLTQDSVTTPIYEVITDLVATEPFSSGAECLGKLIPLSVFFKEIENEGSGFDSLKKFVSRAIPRSLEDQLVEADIASPFDAHVIKELANEAHYRILGYHYFEEFVLKK